MKTKVIALFLCLTMTFALCACAQKEPAPTPTPDPTEDVNAYTPVSFTNHGKEITLKAMPEKVVTAGPGCSEIMCMLGLEESVIGKCMTNHTSAAPEEVSAAFDGIPELAVGYPTYYQIIESGCDFFYASSWVFSDNLKIEDLENAGITVFVSDATDFEWLWAEIRTIGSIFLVSDISAEYITQETAALGGVSALLAGVQPKTVMVCDSFIGTNIYVAGSSNFENALIAAAGAANVFAELEKPWAMVTEDAILAANPEYLIIHNYKDSDAQAKIDAIKADPVLSGLACVQNDRFIVLNLDDVMPGLRTASTVNTISAYIFPELFEQSA